MGDAFWIKEARGVIFQKTTSSVGVYSEDHCKYCFDIFGMNTLLSKICLVYLNFDGV